MRVQMLQGKLHWMMNSILYLYGLQQAKSGLVEVILGVDLGCLSTLVAVFDTSAELHQP